MTHRERLRVPGWWWLLGLGLAATFVIAVGAFLGRWWALAALAVFFVAVSALLWGWGRAEVIVDADALVADGARLEGRWIAGATVLTRAETAAAMRSPQTARWWLVVRPWLPEAVRVDLADPADPHPAWLVGSRRAEALAEAINRITPDKQTSPDTHTAPVNQTPEGGIDE